MIADIILDFNFCLLYSFCVVKLLSPTLDYIRQVVSSDRLKWWPVRLYLDTQRRRLYVTDNEFKDGEFTAGRFVVFSV